MNNKTRIYTRGIQHFQQGGNIAIGSPKPYTTQTPGININPLTLTNAPIEINTTGITDQINKMRDLSFKREELAFKYKELEYKEGKEYLDLLGDIYKGIGSANTSAGSVGGFGSLGVYGQKQAEINAKRNEIMGKINTASTSGRVKDLFGIVGELSAFETSPEVLTHKTKAGFINDAVKSIQKGDLGVYGPEVFNNIFDHVMKGDEAVPFEGLAKNYTERLGGSVASKDIKSYLDGFSSFYTPQEIISSQIQRDGTTIDVKNYKQKSEDEIYNAITSSLSLDPNGKGFAHQLKLTAAELGTTPENLLRTDIKAKLAANSKDGIKVRRGNPEKDAEYDFQSGVLRSIPDVKPEKPSEGDKDREFTMKYVTDRYGHNQKDALSLVGVLKGDALIKRLEELELSGAITPIGGGGKGKDGLGKQATEEEFRKMITIREDDPTMFFTGKDGDRYVATVDEKVAQVGKQFKFPSEVTAYDKVVREKMTPEDAKKWDVNPWEGAGALKGDIVIFKLSSKGGTSANSPQDFDNSKLGEQKIATVKELGLPAAENFEPPINSHLGIMSKDILERNNMRVTDTSKYPHRNKMQSEEGRSFDVNFNKSESAADSLKKIKTVIDEFESRGLRAEYEVKTQKEKDAVLKANPSINPDRILVLGDQITGAHFSVYCDTCSRIQALKGESGGTSTKQIQNTSGIVGKRLGDL